MRKAIGITFVFLSTLAFSCFSQTTIQRFTPDSIKFLEEISTLMLEARKKEAKNFLEEFTPIWYGGVFSDRVRRRVYKTCNFMLKKKMQPFPDFRDYLFSIMSFIKSGQTEESFDAWQENLEKLINSRNKKKLLQYLAFCSHLFAENAIYKSGTTVWKTDNTNYQFEFMDVPFLVFPALNLKCYAKGDSAVIYNTSGVYYPTLEKWKGAKGTVYWDRAGFGREDVFAELRSYKIKMKSSSYVADSVTFTNKFFFNKPLQGALTEKILANVTPEKASYPRFDSYDKRLKIDDIFKNIDYDGGFSQNGSKFIGSGSQEEDAFLKFYRNDTLFLTAASKSYIIRTNKITSQRAGVSMYLSEDSITHPGIKLNYLNDKRLLSLVRVEEGVGKSPYFNTYHNIDMYFEELRWNIDQPTVDMGPLVGATNKKGLFESNDYYKESRFDRMMGIDRIHPLTMLKGCARKYDSNELYADQVAECMKISITQVRQLLMHLSNSGFVQYDFNNDRVYIKERLNHYVNSKSEKEDYDVIQFNSKAEEYTNAKLNMLNNDMRIEGVSMIFLSDSHNVYIYPFNDEILLKKNRDFEFSGIVNAGKFEFFGKQYSFTYDDFKIDMPNVDSLRIYITTGEKDDRGLPIEKRVKSVIEYIKGEVLIDNPGNKSGVKRLPEYPVFNSLKDSYVYYEKGSIQNNVYKKDSFYFHLEPFSFDSIDNFRNEALQFDGNFVSAGIFPDFDEKLALMEDLSLGFIRPTPAEGFPVYGRKGKFTNLIALSHGGLRGDGTLNYITSITESNNFIFYPDSMNTIAQNFVIEELMVGVEFPPVVGHKTKNHWEPYNDFMTIKNTTEPIAMYDGSKFSGELTLKVEGLTGQGLIAFEGAEMEADLMRFNFLDFDSDTAEFRLKSQVEGITGDVLSFATKNVMAHVDFQERKAEFVSNGGGSFVEFPQNQYIAFMDKFTWYMESDDIELSSTKSSYDESQDVQLEGAKFISVHPDQDSITFFSPGARYDVHKHIITANKVKYIPIADALMYPDSGIIIVDKKAKIRTLENGQIVANNVTKFHRIYNASINIFARKNYSASGNYDYVDENKKVQVIHFENITVDSIAQTYGTGAITEEQNFTLSPSFEYKGEAKLTASNRLLEFTGMGRIQHMCEWIPRSWFAFTGEIDPDEIYIPIDSVLKDDKNDQLGASIMLKSDSVHVYSTFLSPVHKNADKYILPSLGFLHYDKKDMKYKISNLAKLNEMSLPGNYLDLDLNECNIYGEGNIDFGADLGQVKTTTVGNMTHYLENDSVVMDVMLLLNFFFNDNALEDMAKNIASYQGLEGTNFDRPVYEKGLQELIGKIEADKLISQVNLYGSFKKFPDEFNKSIFLTDLKMRWNPETGTYQSVGERIGIGNVFKRQINKYVTGYLEVTKKRSGDAITFYLQLDSKNWYFFTYQRGQMAVLSSDTDFNNIIKEIKPDKRKLKVQKGQTPYSFILSTPKRKSDFVKRFVGDWQ